MNLSKASRARPIVKGQQGSEVEKKNSRALPRGRQPPWQGSSAGAYSG